MIVHTQPAVVDKAPSVVAFSDAPNNITAIQEIDQWARDHGFVRSREYSLNVKQTADGNRLYYSACYRLTQEDKLAADMDLDRIRQRRATMPMTASSDTLLREE